MAQFMANLAFLRWLALLSYRLIGSKVSKLIHTTNQKLIVRSNTVNVRTVLKIMVQLYTLDDVKQRNGKNGARTWIVIHDIVYDATDYLKDVRVSMQWHIWIVLKIGVDNIFRVSVQIFELG